MSVYQQAIARMRRLSVAQAWMRGLPVAIDFENALKGHEFTRAAKP
jgi:hypothetical protein